MQNKVSDLQSKLSHAAKQSLFRRFGALYDKVYRDDVLNEAWKRVRSNKGAAGIDEEDIDYIEKEIGVDRFLEEIYQGLRQYNYSPDPILRCYINKADSLEKRPLGSLLRVSQIQSTIRDRVVQMSVKLVIEPIFETNFLDGSYGYRLGRSAQQAIDFIRCKITFENYRIIVNADITKFFDSINREFLMKLVRKRISDPHILHLIELWLEADVMEDGKLLESTGLGTPQGSVISPLLANIYLHSFDKMLQQSGIEGILVRFCDDFVILLKKNGKQVLKRVEEMLSRLKLTLHPDKTRLAHAEKGFDFLGMHFRLCPVKKKRSRLTLSCRLWPSNKSMRRIRQRVRQVIGRRYSLSLEEMIKELNPVIRGWNNYHSVRGSQRKRRLVLNGFVYSRIRIFLKRKYSDQARGLRRVSGNLAVRLGLYQFG